MSRDKMTILEHIAELRSRVIKVAIVIIFFFIVAMYFVEHILQFVLKPIADQKLIFITPSEAFLAHLKLALFTALIVTFPFILYQVLAFILPAFKKQRRRNLFLFFVIIVLLFFIGVSFAYFVVAPIAISFFLGFSNEMLEANITISSYQSFILNMMFAFGFVFQTPILFLLLGKMGLVSSRFLRKNWKYAVLFIVIISAVITPPDVFSQFLMIVPLLTLFEIGIWLVKINEKRRSPR